MKRTSLNFSDSPGDDLKGMNIVQNLVVQKSERLWRRLLLVGLLGTNLFAQAPAEPAHTNRLAQESSPYLLLHAHNPVDWYPWGPEALEKAKLENKPIFLSIGYSSCFWCHVMERKVFENEAIAAYMNQHFVNIKVDREERPDLDDIYMMSLQVYQQLAGGAQGGGWPLSIFLTPGGKPIAGGTYFPPEDMPGRPGFPTVMKQVHAVWNTRQADVLKTAEIIAQEVQRLSKPTGLIKTPQLSTKLVQAAVETISQSYDAEFGGFGFSPDAPSAPKFPVPSKVQLLQRMAASDPSIAKAVDNTLQAMAAGGIRDHLGGGFHRYSTDRQWLVPHFEKMLYDNAQLAIVYTDAYRRTSRKSYRTVAEGTLDFVLRDLTNPHGGFYSALDAETAGVEGQYYVWSEQELQRLLTPAEVRIAGVVFGMQGESAFEHGYIVHLPQTLTASADELGMSAQELIARVAEIRNKLLQARQQRPPLLRDDKVLTSWNGLMIAAFAKAGLAFQRRDYINAAERAAMYVLSTQKDPVAGHLLRTSRGGRAKLKAYVDDYAFLIHGLLALHAATGEDKWLSTAKRLQDDQMTLFWDRTDGGFFFTMHDHESLIARIKSAYDSVMPSGNSMSVHNLIQLSRLTSDETYRNYAEKTLNTFAGQMEANPGGLAWMSLGLLDYIQAFGPPQSGSPAAENLFAGGVSSPRPSEAMPQPTTPTAPTADSQEPEEQKKAVPVLHPTPEEAAKHKRITARGYVSVEKLVPGQDCLVAIEIDVAPTWHINANPAQPDFVIPTKISLKSPEGFELTNVEYPQGHNITLDGIDTPLSVYEKKVIIQGVLKVPANAKNSAELKIELRYQACQEQCERPMKMTLTGTLSVR